MGKDTFKKVTLPALHHINDEYYIVFREGQGILLMRRSDGHIVHGGLGALMFSSQSLEGKLRINGMRRTKINDLSDRVVYIGSK